MTFRRWDMLVVAAAAALSAAVFVALGPGAAQADGADPAEYVRTALDKAQKVELGGCRLSASPAQLWYEAGAEQQIVLRATNPGEASVVLSLNIAAEDVQFTMSRVVMPVKLQTPRTEVHPVALTVEPGQTVETRVSLKLPAGNYSITAATKQPGLSVAVPLCSLRVMPLAKADIAGTQTKPAAVSPANGQHGQVVATKPSL